MPRKKRCSSPFELMDDDYDDTSSQSSRNGNPPIQRNAANARERARMRVLSSAFGRLKTKLPNIPADTKLSKLDTLRLATMYIKQLKTVVEGGPASPSSTNGETIEGSVNGSPTNCYLNLHSGAQSMNWPFGFHHHLTNSASGRSTTSSSLLNSSNWCQNDITDFKQMRYENENYHHHRDHETEQQQQQQNLSYTQQHEATTSQHITPNTLENHWYSDTPSPELDTSPNSTCLCLENCHLNHQQQLHQQHHLSQLQPAITHSSTFHLQHSFQHHHQQHQQQHQQPQHLQHNFGNSSNFQSTSIR